VCLESRSALIQVVGSDVHEADMVKTGLNNYTLYWYCTSTAFNQLNTVKKQHTATKISILRAKSTYSCLVLQRLSESRVNYIDLGAMSFKHAIEITNTIHGGEPLLYSVFWLIHVSAVICHHQEASGSVEVT
jgi:hypothetical protein